MKHPGILLVLYSLSLDSEGYLMLSPSSLAPVCNEGEIELICSVPGVVLTWMFQETIINGTIKNTYPSDVNIQSSGSTARQNRFVTLDFVNFTYSRLSAPGVSPLVSKLVINQVDSSHNGTVVTCIDAMSTNSSSTSLYVVNGDSLQEPELLNITLQSEQFSNRNVTIVLDWMQENESMFHSYNISVVPEVEMIILFNRSTRAQLTLSYSVLYNITVGTTHPCPRIGVYHYGPLYYYYAECGNKSNFSHEVSDYNIDLSVERSNTIPCFPEIMLTTSTGISSTSISQVITDLPESDVDISDNARVFTIVGTVCGVILCTLLVTFILLAVFMFWKRTSLKCFIHLRSSRSRQLNDYSVTQISVSPIKSESDTSNDSELTVRADTRVLVYAEVGQSLNKHLKSKPSLLLELDDSHVKYAEINHNLLSNKSECTHAEAVTKNGGHDARLNVNLDNLLIQLKPQVTHKWYAFGEAVGISKDILDDYGKKCAPDDCIVEVLDYWLRHSVPQLTWKDVAQTLLKINLQQLAQDINEVHTTGKLPIQVDALDASWVPNPSGSQLHTDHGSPPPVPPKTSECHGNPHLMASSHSLASVVDRYACTEGEETPPLPPKPAQMCENIPSVPPRPPKNNIIKSVDC